MSPVWWMAGAALVSWAAIAAMTGNAAGPELFYGMAGPLVVALVTWLVTSWVYRRQPTALTGVMVAGLVVRAIVFGVYVTVMLRGLELRPQPFVASFTGYFIALYGLEALFMKRLFAGGASRQ